MTYIKILTVLTALALLTACGGSATPANNNTGGDNNASGDNSGGGGGNAGGGGGGGGNTTDCTATPFHADCNAIESAITSRETMCLASSTADDSCGGIITSFCTNDPFSTETACMADTYLPLRVDDCITDGNAGLTKCNNIFTATPATNNCLANPFTDACTADMAFTSYLMDARTKRDTFCGTNPSDTVCDTLNLCNGNPFATECEAYFQPARTNLCGGSTDFSTCVNVGDLPTYKTKPNKVSGSDFLTATETGLNMVDISFVGGAPRTVLTSSIGRRGGAGSTNPDGFAYFITTNANFALAGYAGIFPTTNLGAPLPSTTASAVWEGHFSSGTITNIATNYFVDFTNGRFGFSNDGGDGFGTLTHANLSGTYTMNAHFGSHASANAYSAGRMGGTVSASDSGTTNSATIVGLIGAEGVVGVFTEVGVVRALVGGFTATNPN